MSAPARPPAGGATSPGEVVAQQPEGRRPSAPARPPAGGATSPGEVVAQQPEGRPPIAPARPPAGGVTSPGEVVAQQFPALAALRSELAAREARGLRRRQPTVDSPCGPQAIVETHPLLSFASNDYLGLAGEPALRAALAEGAARWGAGSGASHLVSGHLRPHEEAQRQLAAFVGMPAALLFSAGYLANLGVVPALVGRGDTIFADRLNHASLIDAATLSRARHQRFPHRDYATLERLLAETTSGRKAIVVDAVFSMDGDRSDLPQLLALARRHDAWLIVDDAHGFGVCGDDGRGSLSHDRLPADERILYVGTLGKAAGLAGAFVAGATELIDWLMQTARTHVFTTAAPPALSVAIGRSLELIAAGDDRRRRLAALIARWRDACAGLPWPVAESATAIQPLIVGDNEEALRLSASVREAGYWVPAIRPPTVPEGSARLRISLSAAHTPEQVDGLADALRHVAARR
jgi:8-amino-7-oxononanoate synthase